MVPDTVVLMFYGRSRRERDRTAGEHPVRPPPAHPGPAAFTFQIPYPLFTAPSPPATGRA